MSYWLQITMLSTILATTALSAVAIGFLRLRSLRIAACAVFVVSAYLTGYALLGHRACDWRDDGNASYCGPFYRYSWEARMFVPAAAAESFVFGLNVVIGTEDELTWTSPVRIKPSSAH
jgi:hypothetical protein